MRILLTLALVVCCACGDDDTPEEDAGRDTTIPDVMLDPGPARCLLDVDCSDGVYCNGVELCDVTRFDADARGCVPPDGPPCPAERCMEEMSRCLTECELTGDMDDDGAFSPMCGGADCDDMDETRFPGAEEICDSIDQDCDDTVDEGCP